MTVSPRWPQDDAAKSSDAGDQSAAGDSDSLSTPPTLFSLPDLNPAPVTPEPVAGSAETPTSIGQVASNQVGTRSAVGEHAVQPATTAGPVAISPAAADAAATEVQFGNEVNQTQNLEQPFPSRPLPPNDMPAGRSWMEAARQHGVVVLLLLAVVATAIYTGRNNNVDPTDDAIADIDMGEIDEGIAASIPLPVHEHEIDTGVVSAEPSANPDPNDFGSRSTATGKVAAAEDVTKSFASLEPPQPSNQANQAHDTPEDQIPLEAAFVAEDAGKKQVDVTPVGNKVKSGAEVDSDVVFNPPSLESLAESLDDQESELSSNDRRVQTNTFIPVSSKTPNGISDWLRFLPTSPNETTN